MTLPILDLDAPQPKDEPQSGPARPAYDESVGNFEWAKLEEARRSDHIARRFVSGGRGRPWKDTPDSDWNDWRWQQRNRVTRMTELEKVITVTDEERTAFAKSDAMFHMGITPYYASLMDPEDPNDPIRLQSVPSPLEQDNPSGYELEDPLEEDKDSPVPGLTHRYPDRALLVTTHVCTMYCRFCTRKRATMVRGGWDAISRNDERMIEYIHGNPVRRGLALRPENWKWSSAGWHEGKNALRPDCVDVGSLIGYFGGRE